MLTFALPLTSVKTLLGLCLLGPFSQQSVEGRGAKSKAGECEDQSKAMVQNQRPGHYEDQSKAMVQNQRPREYEDQSKAVVQNQKSGEYEDQLKAVVRRIMG